MQKMRKRNTVSAVAAKVLAVTTVLLVVMATMMYVYGVSVLGSRTAGCEMRPLVAGGNGRDVELLLTPLEMRQLLYVDVDTIQDHSSDPMTVSDWRYANMIRSLMTRPNPSRPVRLDSTFITERHFSEGGQSRLIDKRLDGRRNGFFVECGADDGELGSNSLFFELERNWTGLLIEPNPTAYRKLLRKNRNTYLFSGCVSPSGRPGQRTFLAAGSYGGIEDEMPEQFKQIIKDNRIEFTAIPVVCFPLVDILDVIGVHHIDYLSLDIEGPELQVLETIDWQRNRIDIMTVEIHGDMKKLNDSRRLMKRIGGYREVGLQGLDVVYERTDLGKN